MSKEVDLIGLPEFLHSAMENGKQFPVRFQQPSKNGVIIT